MLTDKQARFRQQAIALANRIGPAWGIDWRLIAAAAILESGWGQSQLAQNANNYFGIKATRHTPPEKRYTMQTPWGADRFQAYDNIEESFQHYGRLLANSTHYRPARRAARDQSLRAFIQKMAPVYCPDDPDYATKLHQLIDLLEDAVPPEGPRPNASTTEGTENTEERQKE